MEFMMADDAVDTRTKLSVRLGSSRKLLERKAREKALEEATGGATIEDSFPAEPGEDTVDERALSAPSVAQDADVDAPLNGDAVPNGSGQQDTPSGPSGLSATALTASPGTLLPALAPWSSEDEKAFQAMFARRRASRFQRRGRDVSDQVARVGTITPNPNTIAAVIVSLVVQHGGSMARSELVAAMAGATFPHSKARPSDKGWCQGYVAGAARAGFLAMAGDAAAITDGA